MKPKILFLVILLSFITHLGLSAATPIENETAPIEQEDTKGIDEIIGKYSTSNDATPIEQEDLKTLKQIAGDTPIEDESTPIEQEDSKSIDQINQ